MPALSEQVKRGLKSLRYLAEHGPRMSLPEVLGQKLIPSVHCAELTVDAEMWIVCYGLEVQPSGVYRHLSISNIDRGTLPLPETLMLIAREMGFTAERMQVSVARYPKRGLAVQVMEPITQARETPI
jgi:hypothetical protein